MKDFLVLRVVMCSKRPPRETVTFPTFDVLNNRLHKQLSRAAETYVIQAEGWTKISPGISV